MLELARALSACDVQFCDGWVLANVDALIKGEAVSYTGRVVSDKERRMILEVSGSDAAGQCQKSLRALLFLPGVLSQPHGSDGGQAAASAADPCGAVLARHIFSVQEINAYLAASGDRNILHRGACPIVPGLCMLHWLQRFWHLRYLHWQAGFTAPVYADDAVAFYGSGRRITARARGRQVLKINSK